MGREREMLLEWQHIVFVPVTVLVSVAVVFIGRVRAGRLKVRRLSGSPILPYKVARRGVYYY